MAKSNKQSDKEISNYDTGSQSGAWVNAMLLAWWFIVLAFLFKHGTLSIAVKTLSVIWLAIIVNSLYSGGIASRLFASPTLAGGIVLGLALFIKMPQALATLLIVILVAIIISTPKYVRNEINKQHD